MGYMRHHAIIVTGDYNELNKVAHKCAEIANTISEDTLYVSLITPQVTNNYSSFLVSSDGSKEGWPESNNGDKIRDEIIKYLDTLRFSDFSTAFKYVEVQYGDDNHESKVLRYSEDDRYDK